MKKYTANDYMITQDFKKLNYGLFVEQPKTRYTAMNKWTGEKIGTFDSFEEAKEAVDNICR